MVYDRNQVVLCADAGKMESPKTLPSQKEEELGIYLEKKIGKGSSRDFFYFSSFSQ